MGYVCNRAPACLTVCLHVEFDVILRLENLTAAVRQYFVFDQQLM